MTSASGSGLPPAGRPSGPAKVLLRAIARLGRWVWKRLTGKDDTPDRTVW